MPEIGSEDDSETATPISPEQADTNNVWQKTAETVMAVTDLDLAQNTQNNVDFIVCQNAMAEGGNMNGPEAQSTNGETKGYADADADAAGHEVNGTRTSATVYPELPSERSLRRSDENAWKAGCIRFAPLRIPVRRRLQTASVLFHCMSIVVLVSMFWFTCANPLSWPLLVPYLVHLSFSTAATNGKLAYRSEYLRSIKLWRLFAGYFPIRLHKTFDLDPKRRYVLAYHPHGIISHGAWCSFATDALGFKAKFPGITNTLLTLDSNFRIPFYRDWILAMGIRSVSKESIRNLLGIGGPKNDGQGRAVTIVVGGARESLEAQPGSLRLILKGRKGFIKMALRSGADLVPVIGFGENDLYDQLSPKTHPMVHKLQMFTLRVFKFTLPALHGRGLLNYDVGLMPYRRPVNVVVGKPIPVHTEPGHEPNQAEVDQYHALYLQELEKLWESYKDSFVPGRVSEMEIIS
jgi:2-acylglycerol O-acyltransferase 2